jgi:hypothetical protein
MPEVPEDVAPAGGGASITGLVGGRVGRRGVIAGGGVLLTGAMLEATPLGRQVLASLGFGEDPTVAPKVGSPFSHGIRVEQVRRPADLLVVDLVLVNVATRKIKKHLFLEVADRKKKAYLAVVLPGQNVGETLGRSPSTPVSQTSLALPSVLAFALPRTWRAPYDLERLLDWTKLTPVWKAPQGKPVSRLEAPYRLLLQPSSASVWQHAVAPVARVVGARTTEVWHTRLAGRLSPTSPPDQRVARYRTVTVVDTLKTKLKIPLRPKHRAQIVDNSKHVAAVEADRLILSSLGATLELHGRWPDTTNGLLSWDHRSTLGRDQYVKTVESGFLAPWGHRAAKVTETWRTMTNHGGETVAVQQEFQTIVLLDATVDTSVAPARKLPSGKTGGCALPFTKVRSTVAVTGRLNTVVSNQIPTLYGTASSLRLPFVATDWAGNEVSFVSPVMWVDGSNPASTAWNNQIAPVRRIETGGQRAAVSTGLDGATTMPVGYLQVKVVSLSTTQVSTNPKRARFRPVAESLNVQVPALGAMAPSGSGAGIDHVYHPSYLLDENNLGGVVLGVEPGGEARSAHQRNGPSLGSTRTGGLFAAPSYQGFSKKGGALLASDADALGVVAGGLFDPATVFENIKLLGGISLSDIVDGRTVPAPDPADGLPQLTHSVINGRQTARMAIRPTLHDKAITVFPGVELRFQHGALSVDVVVSSGGTSPAEERLEARLTDAKLQLGGLVVLPIDEFRISSSSSHPLDVKFTVGDVSFLGPLAFVQQLAALVTELLGNTGGSRTADRAIPLPGPARQAREARNDGAAAGRGLEPDVDVSPSGVHVGLSLALPDVAVGVFTLTGLGFGLGVEIGLLEPGFVVDFNFATYDDPFVVTYGPFGGGGFVALRMKGAEVDRLDVSLLIAGGVGVNLGVAAGAISVQAGFVLVLQTHKPVMVTAFFRASGSLEVLGLVSVSVVFEITLLFANTDPITLAGTATLQLKVKVLCCSKTVKASVSRTFAGGGAGHELPSSRALRDDPVPINAPPDQHVKFTDTYPTSGRGSEWEKYVEAFAPDPAFRGAKGAA